MVCAVNSQRPRSQSVCLVCLPVARADWEKQSSEDKDSHDPFIIFKAPKVSSKIFQVFSVFGSVVLAFNITVTMQKKQPVI